MCGAQPPASQSVFHVLPVVRGTWVLQNYVVVIIYDRNAS